MLKGDSQLSSTAGEFITLGKLFKRGHQASITLANAKAIDILVHNPKIDKNYCVQVKTLRKRNCFQVDRDKIRPSHIYVFVILNDFEREEEFFIIKGQELLNDTKRFFGKSWSSSRPAVNYGSLPEYKNNWSLFDR